MQFVNHTPFPALAFAGVDQHDQSFHVVVLRQTLSWDDTGAMTFADQQEPLCDSDAFFDDDLRRSTRQESDLCQYKPRCDVIVNATAYAPQGSAKTRRRFDVRLAVRRPATPAALPAEPQGLNPFMSATRDELQTWRAERDQAERTSIPGECLIDKTLTVSGERHFVRRSAPLRLIGAVLAPASLGLLRVPAWRLTAPRPVQSVPMRLEQAFGGQCRVDRATPAAEKVAQRHHLTPQQAAAHPDSANPPVAHAALDANPVGRGFAQDWYVRATGMGRITAPQIEHPSRPITAESLRRVMRGEAEGLDSLVAGFGIRPKGYPERARLAGTLDAAFAASDAPLPADFDFAMWNAAWPDQQVDELLGDDQIELTNLCAPDTPAAMRDAAGNTVLSLRLPGHSAQLVVRLQTGEIFRHHMRLDTVIVEPDARQAALVWRAILARADDDTAIRAIEAYTLNPRRSAELDREIARLAALLDLDVTADLPLGAPVDG